MSIKQQFINSFVEEVDRLNGTQFESIGRYTMELHTGKTLLQKGHNVEGKPVGYTVDYIEINDIKLVGQSGTDIDYFSSGNKPLKDIVSSLKNCPNCETIFLFSNRRASGGQLTKVKTDIKNKYPKLEVNVYDSEQIANLVYEKILDEARVKEVLKDLPKTRCYYQLFVHGISLPSQVKGYINRKEEEDVSVILENHDYLQIYGLSGIGKTQFAITVASKIGCSFDTVLWINGESLNTQDIKEVSITSFDRPVSLKYILGEMKCLVIIDNLNNDLTSVRDQFIEINNKNSKCIITSLQKDFDEEHSLKLGLLPNDIATKLLERADNRPTDEQIDSFVNKVGGYPLLINLAISSVDCGDYSWDEILSISNITDFEDDRDRVSFAERIIGKYVHRNTDLFSVISSLDSIRICKSFLSEFNGIQYKKLLKASVLDDNELYYCHIHSIVLDSINNLVPQKNNDTVLDYLSTYLSNHLIKRDVGLYTLMSAHLNRLEAWSTQLTNNSLLKHRIVLALIYAQNTYINHDIFIKLIDDLDLNPSETLEDLLLLIERNEIYINKCYVENGNDEEARKNEAFNAVTSIKGYETSITDSRIKATLYNHIGKWTAYSDSEKAEKWYHDAIRCNPDSYNSRYQLARIFNKNKMSDQSDKIYEQTDYIFSKVGTGDVPLSIIMSLYSLLSSSNHSEKLKQYLKKKPELLEQTIEASISCHNTQVYHTLANLSGTLSYEYSDMFDRLCSYLPPIADIKYDEDLSYDYARILLRMFQYVVLGEDVKESIYTRAKHILTTINLKNDFRKRTLLTLYIAHGDADDALAITRQFVDQENVYLFQSKAKANRLKKDLYEALKCINIALEKADKLKDSFKSAFLHDKAEILFEMKDKSCLDVMQEAINLQHTDKTIKQWKGDLADWKQALGC